MTTGAVTEGEVAEGEVAEGEVAEGEVAAAALAVGSEEAGPSVRAEHGARITVRTGLRIQAWRTLRGSSPAADAAETSRVGPLRRG